jgi:hypothetical protein
MDQSEAAKQQHHQVLELCISYISDLFVLVRVCLVSRVQQSQVMAHVQQQLPSLVKQAVAAARQSVSERKYRSALKPVTWILKTAGPDAVSAPPVAEALLRSGPWDANLYSLPEVAIQHGLQLSAQQLVAASKERIKGVDRWLDEAGRRASAADDSSGSIWCINKLDDPCSMVSSTHVILGVIREQSIV